MASPFTTTDQLKANALWLAGEPTDGTSDYDAQVLNWMQLVYDTLINGGSLGTRDIGNSAGLYEHLVDIPVTDWLWIKKNPPFAFITTPTILGSGASVSTSGPAPTIIGTVLLTNNSTAITFSVAPAVSVAGWRLKLLSQASGIAVPPITVPRIVSHTAASTSAVLDAAWPQDTQTASDYILALLEYAMPADFVRFCESPTVQGGAVGNTHLAIGTSESVGDSFPLTEIEQGPPTAAVRLSPSMLQMNRWDVQSYRIEFPYVFTPDTLAVGTSQEPLVPIRFRHILAIGAAMLLAHDKVDSRAGSLSSQFREVLTQMGQEYRKEQMSGSELMGRHLFRSGQRGRWGLRTTSGLRFWP